MNLFLKIFLWFLAAIALMIGMMFFLNWTVQTEPVVSRWRVSVRNQTDIYAATAAQIFDSEGEPGLVEFVDRLRTSETVGEAAVISEDGELLPREVLSSTPYQEMAEKALASRTVEVAFYEPETALTARDLTLKDGRRYALIVSWDRPRPSPFFGESPLRYLRYVGLLATALLLCWALAYYLSSPIEKIRRATRRLADGELDTRVADEVGRRRDELAALARDFDVMAGRIESLVESQKRLSRDVSHELRSPLARMNVALEIAKQRSNGDAAPQLERIQTESNRLNEMISRLLTLSKLESGEQQIEPENIDLTRLVEEVVADADFEAKAKGRSVTMSASGTCIVVGSGRLLRSAVENVLRNAVRYTDEGTTVHVTVTTDDGAAAVRVIDHGGGVPEEELKNLFRPFYRVGEARERKTGGIGLGLAIAERAVKAHKGSINAANVEGGLQVEIKLRCEQTPTID